MPDGTIIPIHGHSLNLVVLGTLLLWVGWYGFTAGSTLCMTGTCSKLASKIAVTTTFSAAGSALTTVVFQLARRFFLIKNGQQQRGQEQEQGSWLDLQQICRALLAGLVSICAGCAVVEPWGAWATGMLGGVVYLFASWALKEVQVDDPCDSCPIHGTHALYIKYTHVTRAPYMVRTHSILNIPM